MMELSNEEKEIIVKLVMKKLKKNIKFKGKDRCDYCEFFEDEWEELCEICIRIKD